MRVLVTGARGQLGRDLVDACERAGDDVIATDRSLLDIADRDAVLGAITTHRPSAVINASAYTAVDHCETNADHAFLVNALAVRHLAEACRLADAHLVHVSTDYVFSGEKAAPYLEWDAPGPLGVYGASKLAGELEAQQAGIGATIVRTSWVCGEHGNNMVRTVLRVAAQPGPLRFVDDQHGCPTFTADLAPLIRRLAVERRPGVHHVTNQRAVSWYGFVREVMELAGHDPGRVEPITTAQLQPPRPARRPANSVLDNAVLRGSGIGLLADFRGPLATLVKKLQA